MTADQCGIDVESLDECTVRAVEGRGIDVCLDTRARCDHHDSSDGGLVLESGVQIGLPSTEIGEGGGFCHAVVDAEDEHYAALRRALATRDSMSVTVSSAL